MPCYHRKSALQQKDDTYFGVTVSENPDEESLEDINVQEFIEKGLEFDRFKGSAEDFSNMIKEGNLVKLSVGGKVYNYNASIYRVEDIIEVTCCKEKKKAMKYSYHGKEVKDGKNISISF